MKCKELRGLFAHGSEWLQGPEALTKLFAHIETCPICSRNAEGLFGALEEKQSITCERCSSSLPAYYDALHFKEVSEALSENEMLEIERHLAACDRCQEIYEGLVLLAELEERDEAPDR
uniref:Putative zinc-finger domain-containing protein n=1 Tax=Thermosporothrix sp. COM3 TaxID=2490863 RepID=A0A455SRT6_9CHLR|nr:hypothetical protein KTC_58740 [Thermosporothrix sp. COM3]